MTVRTLEIPLTDIKVKRECQTIVNVWNSYDETTRAIHILEDTDEYQLYDSARKYLQTYQERFGWKE